MVSASELIFSLTTVALATKTCCSTFTTRWFCTLMDFKEREMKIIVWLVIVGSTLWSIYAFVSGILTWPVVSGDPLSHKIWRIGGLFDGTRWTRANIRPSLSSFSPLYKSSSAGGQIQNKILWACCQKHWRVRPNSRRHGSFSWSELNYSIFLFLFVVLLWLVVCLVLIILIFVFVSYVSCICKLCFITSTKMGKRKNTAGQFKLIGLLF